MIKFVLMIKVIPYQKIEVTFLKTTLNRIKIYWLKKHTYAFSKSLSAILTEKNKEFIDYLCYTHQKA